MKSYVNAYRLSPHPKFYTRRPKAERKVRALRDFEADRSSVKFRVERERISREAKEQLAREQAEKEEREAMELAHQAGNGEAGENEEDGEEEEDVLGRWGQGRTLTD